MKNERQIELSFIEKLKELKYIYREDIKDKASLEENFRKHFQELNRVRLSDSEFLRLKESIITPDVFSAAKILREPNTFKWDDDTPLQYTLVNTNDWCKNEYEVINQLRINTENSHHRYDVMQVSILKKENVKIHFYLDILIRSLKHTNTEKKMTKSILAEFLWGKSRRMDTI